MEQTINYCQASDGVTLAYAVSGEGPPLIRTGMWFTHLEEELTSPLMRARWAPLAEKFTLIRYDMRGTGLSQRDIAEYSEPQLVDDHLSVLNALGVSSASIIAISQGAVVAWLVAEAAPQRVDKIITIGGYLRGVKHRPTKNAGAEAVETFTGIIRGGWGSDDPSFRNVFSTQFLPSATQKELDWFSNFQKVSSTPRVAEMNYRFFADIDLSDRVKGVEHNTLLIHATGDRRVDVASSRDLCAKLPNARLAEINSDDHVPDQRSQDRSEIFAAISSFMGVEILDPAADLKKPASRRVLTTVLFTDIVDSTLLAVENGDAVWSALLARHHTCVREQLTLHDGIEVKTTGDGFHATFSVPAQAIACAIAIRKSIEPLGLHLRMGIHTGECEERDGSLEGIAIHIAARVSATAEDDEIIVSRTVADVVSGSGIKFDDYGNHQMKGLDGDFQLYRVRSD
jgi:class 3 adenylate cyclase